MEKKYVSRDAALQKMQRYCAYQDRSHHEVRKKLLDLGIYGEDLEQIMVALIEEKFLDEERFARSFARGKFQIKGWGRMRIVQELKQRQVTDYCIRKALSEIDPADYAARLEQQLQLRAAQEQQSGRPAFEKKQRLVQYALRKGFEPELIWEMVHAILPD